MNTNQLLDHLANHPNDTMRFYSSDMIMNIHSDEYCLSTKGARSRLIGHFHGFPPEGIRSNSPQWSILLPLCYPEVCRIVSRRGRVRRIVPEHEGRGIFRLTLNKLVHTQPPTPIHCDNITIAGISNNTIKRHRSRSMEMKYFWACDQEKLVSLTFAGTQGKRI